MRRIKEMDEKKRLIIAVLLIIACILANYSVKSRAEAEYASASAEAVIQEDTVSDITIDQIQEIYTGDAVCNPVCRE